MLYGESLSSVTINNQQPSAVSALKKNYIIYANETTQYICGCGGMVDTWQLGCHGFGRVGSSPINRTMNEFLIV